MAKLTNKVANQIIQAATNRKGANLKNLSKPELAGLPEVLVKMIVISTFKKRLGEYWTNLFTELNSLTDEVGALNKVIDVGLLQIDADKIEKAEDLLPNLDAVPEQYAATFMINIKKRVELMISNDVYKLAFTSINAFGNFITALKNQIGNTIYVFMYASIQKQIALSIKNFKKLPAGTLPEFVSGIYNDIAANVPYSNTLNLGENNATTATQGKLIPWSGGGGVDKEIETKVNTISMSVGSDNVAKFDDMNIILEPDMQTRLTQELSQTYHSNFINLPQKFNGVINFDNQIATDLRKRIEAAGKDKADFLMLIIDKSALFLSTRIGTLKEQFWAKGEGSGLMQLVFSFWKTMAVIPWSNGRLYFGEKKTPTTQAYKDVINTISDSSTITKTTDPKNSKVSLNVKK